MRKVAQDRIDQIKDANKNLTNENKRKELDGLLDKAKPKSTPVKKSLPKSPINKPPVNQNREPTPPAKKWLERVKDLLDWAAFKKEPAKNEIDCQKCNGKMGLGSKRKIIPASLGFFGFLMGFTIIFTQPNVSGIFLGLAFAWGGVGTCP